MYDFMCGEVWENVTKNLVQKIGGTNRGDHLNGKHWQRFAQTCPSMSARRPSWQEGSHNRASSASAPRLPDTDQCSTRVLSLADHEISRFPNKERPHMPSSPTAPGRADTRVGVPVHIQAARSIPAAPICVSIVSMSK
jgi:hypothetical protein